MNAAVLYGKEDVRLEEVPLPEVGPGEVLIRIEAALTCGTDLKVFRNGSHPKMFGTGSKPPILFGHEFSGVVEATGSGVTGWRKGQRVVAANSAPCQECFFCLKGQPSQCEDLLFVNGAYAEYLLLPARIVRENLLEIPPHLSFQAAALTEPLACALRGAQAARPISGETVVILGAGPVGLIFVQLAAQAGADLILLGKGEQRLRIGQECGARRVFNLSEMKDPVEEARRATPRGFGADLVIEAVGRPAAWEQAIQLARPGGRVLLFGGCPAGTTVALDTGKVHYGELTILSTFHHTPEAIRQSLQFLADGKVRSEPLISRELPLRELPDLLRRMLTEQEVVKTVIVP